MRFQQESKGSSLWVIVKCRALISSDVSGSVQVSTKSAQAPEVQQVTTGLSFQ